MAVALLTPKTTMSGRIIIPILRTVCRDRAADHAVAAGAPEPGHQSKRQTTSFYIALFGMMKYFTISDICLPPKMAVADCLLSSALRLLPPASSACFHQIAGHLGVGGGLLQSVTSSCPRSPRRQRYASMPRSVFDMYTNLGTYVHV